MGIPKLRNWAVVLSDYQLYKGGGNPHVAGDAIGLDNHRDGDGLLTAPIKTVVGRLVITEDGTSFRLDGEPDPEFHTYLAERKCPYLPDEPLTPLIARGYIRSR